MTEELEIIGQELNCETGEIKPVYRTPEFDAMQAQVNADEEARLALIETKAIAKAALLERLGITEEEALLLFGGN